MTTTKTPPRCTTTGTAKKQSPRKSSAHIVPLPRRAVNLAVTAALVALLACIGSLNIPGIVCAVLALNALCGLILKREETNHENV